MDPSRFDQFARSVAASRSRRSLLRAVSGTTPIVFAAVHRAAGLCWLHGWSLFTRKAPVMPRRRCTRAAGDVTVLGRALALPSVGVA